MFEKIATSWSLVKASATVLKADKELMVFPLVSAVALLLVSASFFVPVFALDYGSMLDTEAGHPTTAGYVLLFAFYVVQYSVIFFFNTALVGAAMIRLDGGDPTVGDGLRIATSKLSTILGYAVLAATVGVVLRAISERSGAIGKFIVGLFGVAWSMATYLVVPVLVTRDVGPIEAVKESAAILKRTWGEQVVGNVGIGLVFLIPFIGLIVVGGLLIAAVATTGSLLLIGTVIALVVVAVLLLALAQATLKGIYAAAVYRYATKGEAGGAFDSGTLQHAFVQK